MFVSRTIEGLSPSVTLGGSHGWRQGGVDVLVGEEVGRGQLVDRVDRADALLRGLLRG